MSERVLICDPEFPLASRRAEILPQAETGRVADAGPGVVAILVSPEAPVGAGDIAGAPDLRLIATASVGTDHIEMDAAEARGIAVVNVPDYCIEEVSDHALAMIVALRRGLIAGDRSVQAGAGTGRRPAVWAAGRDPRGRGRDGPDRPPPGGEAPRRWAWRCATTTRSSPAAPSSTTCWRGRTRSRCTSR